MGARSLQTIAALGLAAGLGACNPLAYPDCYRVQCPYPPVQHDSYAGYAPAYANGRPAFGEPPFDDPFVDYTQRSLTISSGAGNAQAAATVLQTAAPWPRNSANTSIPGDGAQMVDAVHQLENGTRPKLTDTGASSPAIQINNSSGGIGAAGGGAGASAGGGS